MKMKVACVQLFSHGEITLKIIPLGVSNRPDIFQQKMNDLFQGFEFI